MGQQNPFVQFPGHLQFVAGDLTRRSAARGHNIIDAIAKLAQPANAWALDEIDAVLAKLANTFYVKIGGSRTAAEVIAASGYVYCDPAIPEQCVLQQGRERLVKIEVFDVEHFDHDLTDAEVEAEYIRRGLKRPEVDHAVHFGDQVRGLPVEGHPVIFYLKNPVPDADGSPSVLGLWCNGALRGLRWHWLHPRGGRWLRRYLFAGVRE